MVGLPEETAVEFPSMGAMLAANGVHVEEASSTVWCHLTRTEHSRFPPLWRSLILSESKTLEVNLGDGADRHIFASWWGQSSLPPGISIPWPLKPMAWSTAEKVIDWRTYCECRKLELNTPALLALDAVMTIWHIARQHVLSLGGRYTASKDGIAQRGIQGLEDNSSIKIAVLGVSQREIDIWPTFLELMSLGSELSWELHFFGPEIPSWIDGRRITIRQGNQYRSRKGSCCSETLARGASLSTGLFDMAMEFHKGMFHTFCGTTMEGQPHRSNTNTDARRLPFDIIIGLNAGIPCYPSWIQTLKVLFGRPTASTDGSKDPGAEMGSGHDHEIRPGHPRNGICTVQLQQNPQKQRAAQCIIAFSDYNEEAIHRSQLLCSSMMSESERTVPGSCVIGTSCTVNPFRQPFLLRPRDNMLPAMSNGFLLIYEC